RRLKLARQKAKENNNPKDNIQKAVQKGVGAAGGAGFDEVTYEGYGPGGAAVIAECNTDNRNRAAAAVRHAFSHHGGSLGESGCVGWMFKKKGILVVDRETVDEDAIMMLALDSGAEDVKADEDVFEIITAPGDFFTVQEALEKNGISTTASEISMIPDTTVALAGDAASTMQNLIDELEELDDVQEVYTNADLPDEDEE
ncbi:MAG TPA: YebC/PmpR family DNA-binding transcriptional regulator, partial [Veillonellaceae bacterium]|nr:YebC/PmpR family DNA-binding transcriptional regulator [Veillonellaceae bacterium]